mgnify:CR=1 FL=1
MLVFLGVYSALMCTASSLDMIYDGKLCLLLLFAASIVFYGLFTVLETFRKGKLYGLIGITMFFLALVIRFKGALLKGIVSAANSFLKEFMNYTGTNVSLLSYADTESASAKFCTTLLLILIGVYFVALISAFFYRRRRSVVFLAGTIPFVVLPNETFANRCHRPKDAPETGNDIDDNLFGLRWHFLFIYSAF